MTKPLNKSIKTNMSHSPIKWAGGKTWLAPKIVELFQPHSEKRFVELFAGGLGVSFAIKPERVLANDNNPQLIHFYKELQKNPKFDLEMKNEEEVYYQYRELFNSYLPGNGVNRQEAELFYYLNRCGYNGLYRVNKNGKFNSPFGRYKYSNAKNDLTEYHNLIKNWEFSCEDFSMVDIKKDDFLFVDAPYDVEFTSYTSDGFPWEDQVRLVTMLSVLSNPMVLTNQSTPRILKLYEDAGFNISYNVRPRNFRREGNHTKEEKTEIMATRNI